MALVGRTNLKAWQRVAMICVFCGIAAMSSAQDSHYDQLAKTPFPGGYPSKESIQQLKDELVFERAVQSYLWALPALNMYGMKDGSEKIFGAGYNVLPIFKDRLNAKTLVTTPNSDVFMPWDT